MLRYVNNTTVRCVFTVTGSLNVQILGFELLMTVELYGGALGPTLM